MPICSAPVLKLFDVHKKVLIDTDASTDGLGAYLLQEGHPVAYASRSLTASEQNYAQMAYELMAIVFACEKFHQYVYGQPVKVVTDHKPLEALTKTNLNQVSPRLQRMLLGLQSNLVSRVSPLHAPGSERGETLVGAGHVSPREKLHPGRGPSPASLCQKEASALLRATHAKLIQLAMFFSRVVFILQVIVTLILKLNESVVLRRYTLGRM